MPIESTAFLQSISEAFEFRAEDLTMDTCFQDHSAWDSLVSVSTVAMIYAEYDIQVSADELISCKSLSDLLRLVEKKLAIDSI